MPSRRLSVAVSHPDKLYWPEDGYTKRDLVAFYDRVFDKLEPWVKGRLLSLERCPNGIAGECFYQKQAPPGLPSGTATKAIRHTTGVTRYVVGGRRQTQLALANLGCIAVHVWGSRAAAPRKPDWVCFDLDPESGRFADAAKAGLNVRKALDALGLASYPKTSGGRGLHVFVPIRVGPDADDVLSFARRIGSALARSHPGELTIEARVAKRGGRVYLDAARNGFAQTVVAPYSVRARPHAPVSTPLAWSEVRPSLDPLKFNLGNFARRLDRDDPWAGFWRNRHTLPAQAEA
jgi:bifunctional non-homologous end joining protein LigD